MMEKPVQSTAGTERRLARQEAIHRFLAEFGNGEHNDLLEEMMVTISRLAADRTDRGDLKIINTAMRELRYAFKVFAPYGHIPKVTMFGSARTPEDHPQYLEAKKFAERIGQSGWMVITGAGDGIMRAGHHGATRESSFGVSISLPFEQATNTIIMGDAKLVNFKYFFTRKLMFVKEAEAIVLFPGGFGTQDECFEALTLVQTAKAPLIPVVMCEAPGGMYWQQWRKYVESELLGNRMIDPADMDLFYVTDRAEDAVAEILHFYRRYHSMRYVWDRLVIRLNAPLPAAFVTELNQEFSSILTGGVIEQLNRPLEEEEGVFPEKPRLVLPFDRRSTGRLRAMVNRINDAP